MYYAFTDRFANGDRANDKPVDNPKVEPPANYHGGDLAGVRKKIEDGYFEKLGVNTIWVAPLNRNPSIAYQEYPEPHRWYTGYHGYWPVSSTELDPHIGSSADLQALVDAAHARKMKVIADLVLHHVHTEHPWWKEHRDWFGTLDLPDGRKNLRLWDEQQFTTWFEPYLPSFDFSKDAPVKALIDNSVWWLNRYKLDGFRLDAVKHIIPSFWWKFRAALREQVEEKRKVPLYLVGETFKDRAGIMSFVGPNMLDGQFDFPLYDQIKDTFGLTSGGMKALDDALTASEKAYGKQTLMSPLVGNHDKGRFMAYADTDLPAGEGVKEEEVGWKNPPKVDNSASYKKLQLAQAFLMSIDGVPMIYYGDEIGMTGAGDPDNRRDMRFGDRLVRSRDVTRNCSKKARRWPSPEGLVRRSFGVTVVDAARANPYTNAGTFEFLLDDKGNFFFLEVNTRVGRASGHRVDHRHRHRQGADPDRCRGAIVFQTGGCDVQRPRDRMPHQRGRSGDLRPSPGVIHAFSVPGGPGSASTPSRTPNAPSRRITTR